MNEITDFPYTAEEIFLAFKETKLRPEGEVYLRPARLEDGIPIEGNGIGALYLKALHEEGVAWDGLIRADLLEQIASEEDRLEYSRGFRDAQDKRDISCNKNKAYQVGVRTWELLFPQK